MLTEKSLRAGVSHLTAIDADLARVVTAVGLPPLWVREPGFATLLRIILEQQVSLASAKAAFDKLTAALGQVTPTRFLSLSDETLKAIGFSRQKTAYGRILSRAILTGDLDLDELGTLDDTAVRHELTRIKGIGPWTADIYLMMALRRPDAWPAGDLTLAKAVQQVKQLAARPTPDDLTAIAAPWRPRRAVAARILWHHYLSQ